MIALYRPATSIPPTLPSPRRAPPASPPATTTCGGITLDIHPRAVAYDGSNHAARVPVGGAYDLLLCGRVDEGHARRRGEMDGAAREKQGKQVTHERQAGSN